MKLPIYKLVDAQTGARAIISAELDKDLNVIGIEAPSRSASDEDYGSALISILHLSGHLNDALTVIKGIKYNNISEAEKLDLANQMRFIRELRVGR